MREDLGKEMHEEITVRAAVQSVPRIVEFVSAYARGMAFTDERIGRITLALEEALGNIIRFACPSGTEEITVTCRAHEMGSIVLNIIDTGEPFNMLLVSTFPEVAGSERETPSTKVMKRHIKDVEYRRDGANRKNILAWVVSR
jgi:anti-sigma regulatory factor (Ser/Thr protein kinase)